MSQNIGEKQKNYLFFEAYLKTFASVLPTASQTPPKDTHCTPFLWALQISHFWFWGFELEATIVLTPFLKEVYAVSYSDPVRKVVLAFSEFQ